MLVLPLAAPASSDAAEGVPRIRLYEPGAPAPSLLGCAERDRGRLRALAVEPGDWLSFDLEPLTLSPRFKGTLRALNFIVVGDFPEIELAVGPGAPARRFARRESVVRDGVTLSVFDLAFPRDDLEELLPRLPLRFDCVDPGCEGGTSYPYRMRPATIPRVPVVRVNERVQYSSHVVNVVAPYDAHLGLLPAGDRLFLPSAVATLFYQHFSDSYEELVLVPARTHASPGSGAGFDRVHVDVGGIAVDPEDRRADWGGSRVLLHVNTYFRGDATWNYLSLHETGHHWGFQFDLFEVAGLAPRGSTACLGAGRWGQVHQPLLADRPSFLSHCLDSPLCIVRQGGRWVLAEAPSPLFFHPLQAYAMGLLPPEEVPPLLLRRRQDPPASLRPGVRVKGPYVELTIDDVVAHYGPRTGPAVPPVWRRATIVVSPERLLGRKDLAWFNFFARRISDPEVTGIEGLDRTPSLEVATAGAVDLKTEIRPLGGPPLRGDFEVSWPRVGKRDLPGVRLDRKLATRYRAGRRYVISGKVLEPGGHDEISLELGSARFGAEIGPGGRFAVEVVPAERDRGPRWLVLRLGEGGKLLGRVAPVQVE